MEADFLVDTGASGTALPEALARQAGLQPEGEVRSHTAGGVVQAGAAAPTSRWKAACAPSACR